MTLKGEENLGKILDEEYRHKSTYPSDSKAASKPRFRIKWEGSDTTNINMEPEDVNKERIRKKSFLKRNYNFSRSVINIKCCEYISKQKPVENISLPLCNTDWNSLSFLHSKTCKKPQG